MTSAQIFQTQSFFILCLMIYGISLARRHQREKHIKVQSAVIVWDVLLILQIELSRGAIVKASKAMTNTMLLNIHVCIAVLTVVLYGFMVITGRKYLAGDLKKLPLHKRLGWCTLTMRVLTFATSFWSVAPKEI